MQRTATCTCGQLSITLKGNPFRVHCCNCTECHRLTGSAFSTGVYFDDEQISSISGEHKAYTRSGDFGRKITSHFCPTCGVTVFWNAELLAGKTGVSVGCFDDLQEFPRPAMAAWCRSKFPWIEFAPEIPQSQQQTS